MLSIISTNHFSPNVKDETDYVKPAVIFELTANGSEIRTVIQVFSGREGE